MTFLFAPFTPLERRLPPRREFLKTIVWDGFETPSKLSNGVHFVVMMII
jgi:hypothetical protein